MGDGSGSRHDTPCGWASILIDRETGGRRAFGGNADSGSITFAEAMPYVQALTWFDATFGHQRLKTAGFLDVHIVTDSNVIARLGAAMAAGDTPVPQQQMYLGAYCKALAKARYRLHWHWARRDTSELNKICDALSKRHRKEGSK